MIDTIQLGSRSNCCSARGRTQDRGWRRAEYRGGPDNGAGAAIWRLKRSADGSTNRSEIMGLPCASATRSAARTSSGWFGTRALRKAGASSAPSSLKVAHCDVEPQLHAQSPAWASKLAMSPSSGWGWSPAPARSSRCCRSLGRPPPPACARGHAPPLRPASARHSRTRSGAARWRQAPARRGQAPARRGASRRTGLSARIRDCRLRAAFAGRVLSLAVGSGQVLGSPADRRGRPPGSFLAVPPTVTQADIAKPGPCEISTFFDGT